MRGREIASEKESKAMAEPDHKETSDVMEKAATR